MSAVQWVAYAKKFCVALVTALGILAVAIDDGVVTSEWIQVAIAFLGALGVYAADNVPKSKLK